MKLVIEFQTKAAVSDAVENEVQNEFGSEITDDEFKAKVAEICKKLSDKFFPQGENAAIEVDTETMTARVVAKE